MDGVVADSEPLHFEAFRRVFRPIGITFDEAFLFSLVGDSTEKNLRDIENRYHVKLELSQFERQLQEQYLFLLQQSPLYASPGFWRLSELFQNHGYPLGLCTTSSHEIVFQTLQAVFRTHPEAISQNGFFSAIVTADDVKQKKPDPEPYLLVARKLKVPPEHCLVIEDSLAGCHSAKSAGCRCVVLRNHYNRSILFEQADGVFTDLNQVAALFS